MSSQTTDAGWSKLLSLAVHEFRTPLTVVAGYIRMLLKERAGPISDAQRKLLEEAEKSCSRLSGLLAEVNELSALESGSATFNRARLDVRSILSESVASLPDLPDREVQIDLDTPDEPLTTTGDATRLRQALASILGALRRELVNSDRLAVYAARQKDNGSIRIVVGEPSRLGSLVGGTRDDLTTFDEWRGGCGLSLANARRVIEAHEGTVWSSLSDRKAAAVIELPAD